MTILNITEKINQLPQNPGVYLFRDKTRKIIYIGKATNLRSRVGSYFKKYRGSDRPIEMMIAEVVKVDHQETDTVLEALILESNLIKKHQPKYNVKEKDDKSFSYFVITKEEFPRVLIMRKTDLNKIIYAKNFGPYTSKKQMEIALKIMRKIFPFHAGKNKTEKGCLDFQLGLCPGPYTSAISKRDYAKNIRGIEMILQGKKKSLLKKMEKEMTGLAKKEEFEKAGEIRNKIFALQHIQDVALISREDEQDNLKLRIEAYDISNISGQQAVGSMVVFDGGKSAKCEYRKFKIKTVDGANDVAMMQEVLTRRLNNTWAQPDLILLDGGQGHLNMAQKLLSEMGFTIPLVSIAKGPTRKKVELQFGKYKLDKRAEAILQNENLLKSIMDEAHRFAITYHRKVRKREFI